MVPYLQRSVQWLCHQHNLTLCSVMLVVSFCSGRFISVIILSYLQRMNMKVNDICIIANKTIGNKPVPKIWEQLPFSYIRHCSYVCVWVYVCMYVYCVCVRARIYAYVSYYFADTFPWETGQSFDCASQNFWCRSWLGLIRLKPYVIWFYKYIWRRLTKQFATAHIQDEEESG